MICVGRRGDPSWSWCKNDATALVGHDDDDDDDDDDISLNYKTDAAVGVS